MTQGLALQTEVFWLVSQISPDFQSPIISYWQHQGSELLLQALIPGPKSLSLALLMGPLLRSSHQQS